MKIEENSCRHMLLKQLLAVSACSDAQLYKQACGLSVLSDEELHAKSFHYHVRKLKMRDNELSHMKRSGMTAEDRQLSLAGCRLFYSARLNYSVRLVPFIYHPHSTEPSKVAYGVLGVVQELCSRLLQAEILVAGMGLRSDLCILDRAQVTKFVATAISLPRLKIASVHFPAVRYRENIGNAPRGLVPAWLGYSQETKRRPMLESDFGDFSDRCISEANWAGQAHKLKPKNDIFQADFPMMSESDTLDLRDPCGKPWRLRTIAREINKRVDQWNSEISDDRLNPILRIWIARQCYDPIYRLHGDDQKNALASFCRSVLYQKNLEPENFERMQECGISYINDKYPNYR